MYIKIFAVFCAVLTFGLCVSLSNAQIDSDKIVGIWLLDETTGDTAEDASENGYDGTIKQSDWVKGKVNGALDIKKGVQSLFHSAKAS
ncbi:hypothetical protein F4X73_10460 [Candidatus Poribacteria bacterium]|nr:hypothetical protein [Candidatus Poribacteria bacterium]